MRRFLPAYAFSPKDNNAFDVYSEESNWNQERKFYQRASQIFEIIVDITYLSF